MMVPNVLEQTARPRRSWTLGVAIVLLGLTLNALWIGLLMLLAVRSAAAWGSAIVETVVQARDFEQVKKADTNKLNHH